METGRDAKKLPFGDSLYGNFTASNLGINIFTGYACGSRDVLDGTIGMTDATAVHASAIDTTAIDAAVLTLWSQV